MRRLAWILALGLCSFTSAAAPVEVLPDFTLAAPAGARVSARLLVAPLAEAFVDRAGPFAPSFGVGPGDAVWFGLDPGVLVNATKGYRFHPGVAFSDFAVLDGGTLLLASADALGFLAPGKTVSGAQVAATFQPIASLPVAEARLAVGGNGALYAFGPARDGSRNEVWLLAPEVLDGVPALRRVRRVFASPEKISAVAGDGATTYVASGRLVVKLERGFMKPVFAHPREEVTGLALAPDGLFYATAAAVGVIAGQASVEFIRASNPVIRSVAGKLYVLLKNSLAVVRLEGLDALRPGAAMKPLEKP